MPAVINTYAPQYAKKKGISVPAAKKKLEEHWEKCKEMAKKKFKEGTDQFYAYTMGIWKKMNMFESTSSFLCISISLKKDSDSWVMQNDSIDYAQDDYDNGLQTLIVRQCNDNQISKRKEVWKWPLDTEQFQEFDERQRSGEVPRDQLYTEILENAELIESTPL